MRGRRMVWDVEAYLERARAACFVCEMLAGREGYEHHVIYRDEVAVAFLAKYPSVWGHTLVAPVDHREHVVDDFTVDEYVALQQAVHRIGRALSGVVEPERLYIVSFGSQSGNPHVHWHLVPLPPGVPFEEQQGFLFSEARGWLQFEQADLEALAASVTAAIARATR